MCIKAAYLWLVARDGLLEGAEYSCGRIVGRYNLNVLERVAEFDVRR